MGGGGLSSKVTFDLGAECQEVGTLLGLIQNEKTY